MTYKEAKFIINTYEKDVNSGKLKNPELKEAVEEARKVTRKYWDRAFKKMEKK
jgi:hypothetical protein